MREMVVGLRAREMLERKVRKVGLDRDAGGGEWDGCCRVGVCKRVCVCDSGGGWVRVCVCDGGGGGGGISGECSGKVQ